MDSNSRLTSPPPRFWKIGLVAIVAGSLVGLNQTDFAWGQSRRSTAPARPPAAAPPTTPAQPPASRSTDKPFLKLGSQGTEVTEVQALLKLMGYYTGAINGTYDDSTANAVFQFQKAAGLSPDGIVGTDTWNALLPPAPPTGSTPPATQGPGTATPTSTQGASPPPGTGKPATTTTPATPKPPTSEQNERTAVDVAALPILRLGMKGPAVAGLQERLRALGYLKGGADGVFGPETQTAVKAAQRVLKLEADGVVGAETWLGLLR